MACSIILMRSIQLNNTKILNNYQKGKLYKQKNVEEAN